MGCLDMVALGEHDEGVIGNRLDVDSGVVNAREMGSGTARVSNHGKVSGGHDGLGKNYIIKGKRLA
jgi:hypothetical protein